MNYGKIAYEAYCKSVGWKSVKGEPLPHFEEQAPHLQTAWEMAGLAVASAIVNQTSPG